MLADTPITSDSSYRARYYDLAIGRFLSEDPIQWDSGTIDFYSYVGNDPINFTDPSGLCKDNRFLNCLRAYYLGSSGGAATTGTRAVSIASGPLPKVLLFERPLMGSSSWTTLASKLSIGMGTIAQGNWLRAGGRLLAPVAGRMTIAGFFIDAAALSMCTTDYVPSFLYKIAKHDPFSGLMGLDTTKW